MNPAFIVGRRALRAYFDDHAASYAAAIAYHTLFSLFPLSLFLIGFAGYVMTPHQRDRLVHTAAQALGSNSNSNIERQIRLVTNGRAGLGLAGLLIALWSASAVFGAVRTGLHVVWKPERNRPYLLAKALDLLSVFAFGVLLALSFAGTVLLLGLLSYAQHLLGKHLAGVTSFTVAIIFLVVPIGISFLTFLLLYGLTSPRRFRRRDTWPGALTAAAGFQLVNLSFSLYVSSFAHFDKVYGSLGAVIAFLLYAYLLGCLIMLGAEVAAAYGAWRSSQAVGAEPWAESAGTDQSDEPGFIPRPAGFRRAAHEPRGDRPGPPSVL